MRFYSEQAPAHTISEMLQEAAARTGFTPAEMEEVLESELTMEQLLNYIDAVVSRRMN